MSRGPEAKVKDKLSRWLKITYPTAWIYKAPGGRFGRKGVPDILACIYGKFVAIEVKADETKEVTPIQMNELQLIAGADGIVCILRGIDGIKLEKLKGIINAGVSVQETI